MPSLAENIQRASTTRRGADVRASAPWGGVASHWVSCWLPRLFPYLPASTILEIGPGHGRWSGYLRTQCERLVLVDCAPTSAAACRRRFAGDESVTVIENDGLSLEMIPDESIDLVVSLDALVHVELDVLVAYRDALARVLSADGVAVLHHSNLAAYGRDPNPGWRGTTGLASDVRDIDALACVSQELLPAIEDHRYVDAVTVLTRPTSRFAPVEAVCGRNATFLQDVKAAAARARLYAAPYTPRAYQPGKDCVWVPTAAELVEKMLDMAQVSAQDYVVDLGSGDGRLVIAAAQRGAQAHGVEYNGELVALSQRTAAAAKPPGRATFAQGDLFKADLSKATVVAVFLLPSILKQLEPRLRALPPGTRIVTNAFTIGEWAPDQTRQISARCTAHLWVVR